MKKHNRSHMRLIPYHSVGKKQGILPGILVTDLQITNGKERYEAKKGVVAVAQQNLFRQGHYQMLLHPDLIKNGRS